MNFRALHVLCFGSIKEDIGKREPKLEIAQIYTYDLSSTMIVSPPCMTLKIFLSGGA
jgi:hypothetical protein